MFLDAHLNGFNFERIYFVLWMPIRNGSTLNGFALCLWGRGLAQTRSATRQNHSKLNHYKWALIHNVNLPKVEPWFNFEWICIVFLMPISNGSNGFVLCLWGREGLGLARTRIVNFERRMRYFL